MNIVVLVKQVPDTWAEGKLKDSDKTLDRASVDVVMNEIDEYAVEEALRIKEAQGGEVTILTMDPERATETIRKALSMGADKAVHLVDPALHGKGHGRRIVRRLLDIARWHRAERVYLEVRPTNARAILLYDSMGFNEFGRRPNYYPAKKGREDALVMAIELLSDRDGDAHPFS